MKNHKRTKKQIPHNQKTFDDFTLLRDDEMHSILESMKERIEKLSDNADISEINSFSRDMEEDLKKLKVNVAGVRERFGMLDALKIELKKNPGDAVISSAIDSIERSYALKLVELANKQIEKYV